MTDKEKKHEILVWLNRLIGQLSKAGEQLKRDEDYVLIHYLIDAANASLKSLFDTKVTVETTREMVLEIHHLRGSIIISDENIERLVNISKELHKAEVINLTSLLYALRTVRIEIDTENGVTIKIK